MDDLSERLFAHHVGGRWRVPLSEQLLPVAGADGRQLGQIVLAGARDIARAQAVMRGADGPSQARLAQALEAISPALAEAVACAEPAAAPVLLTTAPDDPAVFGAALGASLGQGGLWCPRPAAVVFAIRVAAAVDAADLPPGAFALLHALTPITAPLLKATGLASSGGGHMQL